MVLTAPRDVVRKAPARAPWLVGLVLFAAYAIWSVHRHLWLRTSGYDLGIFEQAVRGYARLGPPELTIKAPGFSLLGDHFHPILAVLAPVYRLFPSALTLLIAQAALLAVSSVPIVRLAARLIGTGPAVCVGLAYGLSWGLQSTVDFDFHEVAFAVPLLAFSLTALVERRWTAAAGWALPLILVKEDLPATVAVIGLLLLVKGRRRLGGALIAVAVGAGLLIVGVILPAFNPAHVYPYAASAAADGQNPLHRLLLPAAKLRTLGRLLAPTGFLAVRSSVLLAAVPTLAWRFWSQDPFYWGTAFQYSAVLMPIVFVAMLDTPGRALLRWAAYGACVFALASTVLTPLPLRGVASARTWQTDPTAQQIRLVLARIPAGAKVAADNRLAPQLTSRCTVYFFPGYPQDGVLPEWVAISTPLDTSMAAPVSMTDAISRLPGYGYRVEARTDGMTLYRRR